MKMYQRTLIRGVVVIVLITVSIIIKMMLFDDLSSQIVSNPTGIEHSMTEDHVQWTAVHVEPEESVDA